MGCGDTKLISDHKIRHLSEAKEDGLKNQQPTIQPNFHDKEKTINNLEKQKLISNRGIEQRENINCVEIDESRSKKQVSDKDKQKQKNKEKALKDVSINVNNDKQSKNSIKSNIKMKQKKKQQHTGKSQNNSPIKNAPILHRKIMARKTANNPIEKELKRVYGLDL